MDKILVLGSNSRLATCFKLLYPKQTISLSKKNCDITKREQIERRVKKFRGKYVLNCAAITDLEECELNPKKCFDVNTLAVFNLDQFCLRYKKKLIHISSDYAINPVNIYGLSKCLSENILNPKSLIVRTNFYDEKTFVVRELLGMRKLTCYKNKYFNPVSVNGLVRQIYKNKERKGIINIASQKKLSFCAFSKKFCGVFELNYKKLVSLSLYQPEKDQVRRPLDSFIKPHVKIDITKDLKDFKKYLKIYVN